MWLGYCADKYPQVAPEGHVNAKPLATAVFEHLQKRLDAKEGGFGNAPKFASPSQTLYPLARFAAYHLGNPSASVQDRKSGEVARDMAVFTMTKIYQGGIRDVVGGGFARYSVDERWHVPHCE